MKGPRFPNICDVAGFLSTALLALLVLILLSSSTLQPPFHHEMRPE